MTALGLGPTVVAPANGHMSDVEPLSEAAQQAFFDAMVARAERAADRSGARNRYLDLNGQIVRLIFAGPALEDFAMPALAHLETAPSEPDVTVRIWDGAQSGVPMVQAPCSQDCLTERGDIWGLSSRRYLSAFRHADSSVSVFDTHTSVGVYWVSGRAAIPASEAAAPFRILFGWALRTRQRYILPAASVATQAGAALLLGAPDLIATIAARCADVGLHVAGDRFVVMATDATPAVAPLYAPASRATIAPGALPGEDRPLRAVLYCEAAADGQTQLLPADRSWSALATAYAAVSVAPGADPPLAAAMQALAARLDHGLLTVGSDLATVPEAVGAALHGGIAPRGSAIPGTRQGLSVIIPVFNGARFLPGAVTSVLRESPDPLDLIIVDDGSEDDIDAAVATLPVPARLLRQQNRGPAAARNLGIEAARYDTIGFLDVDDLWPAGRLAALWAEFTRRPDAAVARGHAQLFRISGPDGAMQYLGPPAEAFPDYIGAGLFRRAAFDRIGGFDAGLTFDEDSDWFERAGEAGLVLARAPLVSLLVRRHEGNMTRAAIPARSLRLRAFRRRLERSRKRETEAP